MDFKNFTTVIGLGIDVVEVARIKQAVQRFGDRFLHKIFTARELSELSYAVNRTTSFLHLAGRFAAKEAVAKALGTGISGFAWRDIEILRDERGKPVVVLAGGARETADRVGIAKILVSVSHTRDLALAEAIALGGGEL